MYAEDLAYIHDRGYSTEAGMAARLVVRLLQRHGITRGLVLDLGCGSGESSREFTRAGFDVLGIDASPAMIRLAARRVPRARFLCCRVTPRVLRPCDAVVAIGEVLNYLPSRAAAQRLIRRMAAVLNPGGLLFFDVRQPLSPRAPHRWIHGRTGRDWLVMALSDVDRKRQRLTRKIVTFRRVKGRWRRHDETHRQLLYAPSIIRRSLRSAGLRLIPMRGEGTRSAQAGCQLFAAWKPGGCIARCGSDY